MKILIWSLVGLLVLTGAGYWSWHTFSSPPVAARKGKFMGDRVEKSNAEWKAVLTPMQYHVTREKGTERAGTGEYNHCKDEGMFTCVCCGMPLFDTKTKYESGSGWPSFWQPVNDEHVTLIDDRSHGMVRTEVTCSRCDAHLGHVFPDGPRPTGQRYCINSASLKLEKR